MSIKSFVPNFFTSLNLVFGCLAIIEIFQGRIDYVIYYTFLSGIADFLDGFTARLLNASSSIGKDLDSLADMVAFSIVPAFLMYKLIEERTDVPYLPYAAFIIAVFSALRLAKFNNDSRQSDSFHGLPVPANALFLCALPLYVEEGVLVEYLSNPYILLTIVIGMASLLVTDVKLIALKFKSFSLKGNESRYILIAVSLIALMTYQLIALPFVVLFYFVISMLVNRLSNK